MNDSGADMTQQTPTILKVELYKESGKYAHGMRVEVPASTSLNDHKDMFRQILLNQREVVAGAFDDYDVLVQNTYDEGNDGQFCQALFRRERYAADWAQAEIDTRAERERREADPNRRPAPPAQAKTLPADVADLVRRLAGAQVHKARSGADLLPVVAYAASAARKIVEAYGLTPLFPEPESQQVGEPARERAR